MGNDNPLLLVVGALRWGAVEDHKHDEPENDPTQLEVERCLDVGRVLQSARVDSEESCLDGQADGGADLERHLQNSSSDTRHLCWNRVHDTDTGADKDSKHATGTDNLAWEEVTPVILADKLVGASEKDVANHAKEHSDDDGVSWTPDQDRHCGEEHGHAEGDNSLR